jgi:hypothetical protein
MSIAMDQSRIDTKNPPTADNSDTDTGAGSTPTSTLVKMVGFTEGTLSMSTAVSSSADFMNKVKDYSDEELSEDESNADEETESEEDEMDKEGNHEDKIKGDDANDGELESDDESDSENKTDDEYGSSSEETDSEKNSDKSFILNKSSTMKRKKSGHHVPKAKRCKTGKSDGTRANEQSVLANLMQSNKLHDFSHSGGLDEFKLGDSTVNYNRMDHAMGVYWKDAPAEVQEEYRLQAERLIEHIRYLKKLRPRMDKDTKHWKMAHFKHLFFPHQVDGMI